MKLLLLSAMLAAVQVGGVFGQAEAEALDRTATSMTVDIRIEVRRSVEAVVAHLRFDREPELTLPLLSRGEGEFGITTELAPRNYVVVFDAVGPDGGLSDPFTLQQLGVEFPVGSAARPVPTTTDEGLTADTRRVGWLGLALGAASLAALAIWVLGGADRAPEAAKEDDSELDTQSRDR